MHTSIWIWISLVIVCLVLVLISAIKFLRREDKSEGTKKLKKGRPIGSKNLKLVRKRSKKNEFKQHRKRNTRTR